MADERAVISAVLAGDTNAFAELVRAHQARVRLACIAFLGNPAEADDAAQDVFVKAFKALKDFRGDSSFRTWLLRITENHCRDLLRARKDHRSESIEALLESQGHAFEALLSRGSAEETPPYSPQDLELLGRLFAALPVEDREILRLREVEEFSYEEISQRLNCSLDAVKGRLKRARQNLIDKLSRFTAEHTSKNS